MEKIYVGFSRPNDPNIFSKAIMWGENSEFSHVYIRRKSTKVGEYVYQASGVMVNFMAAGEGRTFDEHNLVIAEYEFDISDEKLGELVKFFITNAGKPYSFKQIIALTKIILMERVGLKPKYPSTIDGDEAFICSEIALKVIEKFLDIKVPGAHDLVTPVKLKPIIEEKGKLIREYDKFL